MGRTAGWAVGSGISAEWLHWGLSPPSLTVQGRRQGTGGAVGGGEASVQSFIRVEVLPGKYGGWGQIDWTLCKNVVLGGKHGIQTDQGGQWGHEERFGKWGRELRLDQKSQQGKRCWTLQRLCDLEFLRNSAHSLPLFLLWLSSFAPLPTFLLSHPEVGLPLSALSEVCLVQFLWYAPWFTFTGKRETFPCLHDQSSSDGHPKAQ